MYEFGKPINRAHSRGVNRRGLLLVVALPVHLLFDKERADPGTN